VFLGPHAAASQLNCSEMTKSTFGSCRALDRSLVLTGGWWCHVPGSLRRLDDNTAEPIHMDDKGLRLSHYTLEVISQRSRSQLPKFNMAAEIRQIIPYVFTDIQFPMLKLNNF
jgi:hypothetical protein